MNENYLEYISSQEWKDKKIEVIKKFGSICKKCGIEKKPRDLDLHHKSYLKIECKDEEDLLLVCKECHREFHQDLEFFDNIETVGLCSDCRRPMKAKGNKLVCDWCNIEIEPKIK